MKKIFNEDIIDRIHSDFKESEVVAIEILQDAINKTDYLNCDRVIRCIIFLANGNLDELKKMIETATLDTRDVMLWAEYQGAKDSLKFKRIRNFNNTFDKCMEHVEE